MKIKSDVHSAVYLASCVLCLASCNLCIADDVLPSAEDVNRLADSAIQITESFLTASFEPRMRYEYKGGFSTAEDRQNLRTFAQTAASDMIQLVQQLQLLRQQIEDYEGNDWEARFGSTGLWRRIAAEVSRAQLTKAEIDYYFAVTCEGQERDRILRSVVSQIDSVTVDKWGWSVPDAPLCKGRALAALAQNDANLIAAAQKEFGRPLLRSDNDCSAFRAEVERAKLSGQPEPNELASLAKRIRQSACRDDIELVLSLAFLQGRCEGDGAAQTIAMWPEIGDIYGDIILRDLWRRLEEGQDIGKVSAIEAEAAALAAMKNNLRDYQELLGRLAEGGPARTPLTLYAAAAALAEPSPAEAVSLFVQAAKLQQQQPSGRLEHSSIQIARQAAAIAYNLLARDANSCDIALSAFDSYRDAAKGRMDGDIEYLYCSALDRCGQKAAAADLREEIAARPPGTWRNRAKLDLIMTQLRQSDPNMPVTGRILTQLRGLIDDCNTPDGSQNEIFMQAATFYCELLLAGDKESYAKEVLEFASVEMPSSPTFAQFKVRALYQLGRLEEAVAFVAENIPGQDGCLLSPAAELLFVVLDQIELWQQQAADYNTMIAGCEKIAQITHEHFDRRQTAQLLAEASLLAAGSDDVKLAGIEKTLYGMPGGENVVFLRCRARLFGRRGNFRQAAELWAKICELEKDKSPAANARTWNWWRAKYYQLECLAEIPQADKNDIRHTIEVLENSFSEIPPLWSEKLAALKKR